MSTSSTMNEGNHSTNSTNHRTKDFFLNFIFRFTCPHCNRKFRHPTHFKEHVKKHGEVSPEHFLPFSFLFSYFE